jgi:GNAT superfamily N-acetyltransferase
MSARIGSLGVLGFREATPDDALKIASLRSASANALTGKFGHGPWSSLATERGVLSSMRHSRVIIAVASDSIVGVLRLAMKKPWAIDVTYFTQCRRPVYLTDMAVAPEVQRQGIGRELLDESRRAALEWGGEALRLDAYDAAAGAGGFYARCGFDERGRVSYRGTPLVYFERRL